jgi:hypothetical protein
MVKCHSAFALISRGADAILHRSRGPHRLLVRRQPTERRRNGGPFMGPRKPSEAATDRAPDKTARAIREAGVRAVLRQRRRRRADEAGLQSLVRALAAELPSGRGR